MEDSKSSSVVIAEAGADWTRHADEGRGRFGGVITLLQQPGEPPHAFSRRVREKLRKLRGVTAATLLWRDPTSRGSIGARRLVLDGCLNALAGAPRRELSLIVLAEGRRGLPQWIRSLAHGLEERDPGLSLSLAFAPALGAA